MQKIKIRLPATITNLGPGLNSLGLALGLYTTVEVSGRNDERLNIELAGEGTGNHVSPLRHPVILAMGRFFQRMERAVLGINIKVNNQIPLNSGLGAEAALTVAGVLGANNLMGNLCRRDELLQIAARITEPDGVVASLLGGLAAGVLDDDGSLMYQGLPVAGMEMVVVLPELDNFMPPVLPEQIVRRDALYNLARVPLLVDALRRGDLRMLARVLGDRVYMPRLSAQIPGYGHVVEIARRSGALAVTCCGDGPALLVVAEVDHEKLAEDMVLAFASAGVKARSWVLPVDTQGVVISAVQSA
jgi:homoserine kinase